MTLVSGHQSSTLILRPSNRHQGYAVSPRGSQRLEPYAILPEVSRVANEKGDLAMFSGTYSVVEFELCLPAFPFFDLVVKGINLSICFGNLGLEVMLVRFQISYGGK